MSSANGDNPQSEPQRPRLNLKPRNEAAAKAAEAERQKNLAKVIITYCNVYSLQWIPGS